jgi:hypothetical protein
VVISGPGPQEVVVRRTVSCLVVLSALWVPRAAPARTCTIDAVPAATLLLPYFEVDLDDPVGRTTLFSVSNASDQGILAHVVFWSDLSVPVLDFHIYLTGYDVESINLRDILVAGVLPRTAPAGLDPGDQISPKGECCSGDIDFASCAGILPLPEKVPQSFIDHLQLSLTGELSPLLNGCAGLDYTPTDRPNTPRIARGYVTIDTMRRCALAFPGDPGYFVAGGNGDATNQNVLIGDYIYLEPPEFAHAETMVHVEASATDPETSTPGQYTFYGRYVGWSAADNREPLGSNFAARYLSGGPFTGGTDLVVWRDTKLVQNAFPCQQLPSWFPLGQERIVLFDEQEQCELPDSFPIPVPRPALAPFPAAANRVQVDSPSLPTASDFGLMFLNLNNTVAPAGIPPPEDPVAAQAWVTVVMDAESRYSVGFDAYQLDSACDAQHPDCVAPERLEADAGEGLR